MVRLVRPSEKGRRVVTEPMLVMYPIGRVESTLTAMADAPRQGDEGAGIARVVLDPAYRAGIADLRTGTQILLLTWLDRARRDVLTTHPRGDQRRPMQGVFSTRSPHRPNPIGLHRVTILAIDDLSFDVEPLEALDGTPVLDIKPVLEPLTDR